MIRGMAYPVLYKAKSIFKIFVFLVYKGDVSFGSIKMQYTFFF